MTDVTADDARKILEAERQKRFERFQAKLNSLLETHECRLACRLSIVDGRIVGDVVLVEK